MDAKQSVSVCGDSDARVRDSLFQGSVNCSLQVGERVYSMMHPTARWAVFAAPRVLMLRRTGAN